MTWRRIRAIFRKDMMDALRDSRVLTALIMPLAFGLLYSIIFNDEDVRTTKVKVGVVAGGETQLTSAISKQVGDAVRLTFLKAPDVASIEEQVRRDKIDVGLVLPAGFDAGVKAGASPRLSVVMPSASTPESDYVIAVLSRSVETMAGRAPPALIERRTLPPDDDDATALDVLGARKNFILVAMIMLLAMIAVYAVPAVLVEETEKKTMEALTLIASTTDVIAAKALFGMALSVIGVPVLLFITRGRPDQAVAMGAVVVLSAFVLVGIGLLTTAVLKTQQQVNTWSGAVLLVLLAPAVTVGIPTPDFVNRLLWLLPTGHSFRLLANTFSGRTIYSYELLSVVMLVAWAAVAYGVLSWRLSRQEAV